MTFEDQMAALPPERREAIAAWLQSSLGDCGYCGRPVTMTDKRRLEKDEPVHLECGPDA